MNPKVYCEHRWIHTHENLHYEVVVRALAFPAGVALSPIPQPIYGEPFVTVLIGGEWMGNEAIRGDPEITETDARHYVARNLKMWENIGSFGPHLSQEAASRRASR